MPFRKTKPTQAALTSYAGKIFVNRSSLVKHNYAHWLRKVITAAAMSSKDERITHLRYGANKVPNVPLPITYTALMSQLTAFESDKFKFNFAYDMREKIHGKEVVAGLEKNGGVVCGTYNNNPMVMDKEGFITAPGLSATTLLDATGGNWGKAPRDMAVFKSLNRNVPVIFFLGYILGLNGVIKKTKSKVRYEPLDRRPTPTESEMYINFADERLYVNVRDAEKSLLWSGLKDMEDMTSRFNLSDFNRKDGWLASISHYKANVGHCQNWAHQNNLFLDPITIEILEEMGEPTNLVDLMLRCVDVIKTDDAPDEADPKFMRVRGMERIAGLIYLAMYDAILEQSRKPGAKNEPISLPAHAIRQALGADNSVQLVDEINAIHNLKEQEAVTLAGEGGRTARTLVKRNRVYHQNDLGILSESTPDSAKVGIRSFFTPNAKLESLRGMAGEFDPATDDATSLLSTSALLLPDMHRDDG